MYQTGEIELVMDRFEQYLPSIPVYLGGKPERAKRQPVKTESGRVSQRFANNNYYEHGDINKAFLFFLYGYSLGKSVGTEETA
jgi:hypothetical protein